MRLLQVSPFKAYPPTNGGSQRVHGLMTGRPADARVRRFAETPDPGGSTNPVTIDSGYVEYRFRNVPYLLSYAISRFLGVPHIFNCYTMRLAPSRFLSRWIGWADAIMIEAPFQFRYLAQVADPETPLIYSSHNFEPERCAHIARSILTRAIYRRIIVRERQAVREADLTIVASERDRTLYRDRFDADGPFHVAPNAAYRSMLEADPDVSALSVVGSKVPTSTRSTLAVFVGSEYEPNVDAARAILRMSRRPEIRRADIHFLLIGSVCDAIDATAHSNVHTVGFVTDLAPYYAVSDVALNPVTGGGGSNLKLPEYFAHGLPVVSTPFGARGFPVVDGEHLLVRERREFARALTRLGEDRMARLSTNARRLVADRLNWSTVSSGVFDRIQDLLSASPHH